MPNPGRRKAGGEMRMNKPSSRIKKMKTEMKPNQLEEPGKKAPKAKTLDLQLSIRNPDLGLEVRKAFDLAKSSGLELNLSFSQGARLQLHNRFEL